MAYVQQCLLEQSTLSIRAFAQDVTGNIIPNECYRIILNEKGTPDLSAITVFTEILYWYRPDKFGNQKFRGDAWQTSHSHFKEKFGYYDEKTRRAFVRLEELELIRREHRTVRHYGQQYPNRLFIHLTDKAYKLLEIYNSQNILPCSVGVSPQNVGEHIKESKNIENNRSMNLASNKPKSESNFSNFKNQFLLGGVKPTLQTQKDFYEKTIQNSAARCYSNVDLTGKESGKWKQTNPIPLSDFLPISDKTCETLQIRSGREFNKNAINEILESVAKKVPNRKFVNKRAFESYASKVLANEIRQAEQINNCDFRIKSNISEENLKTKEIEEFLEKVENSRNTEETEIFRKKIASSFDKDKAYMLLQSLQSSRRVGDEVILSFTQEVELSPFEKDIIIPKAIEAFDHSRSLSSKSIKIRIQNEKSINKEFSCADVSEKKLDNLPDNIWGKVRGALIEKFGSGSDKSWFSKLQASIDEKNKSIELVAPTGFMQSWIESHYKAFIDNTLKGFGFRLEGIETI